MAVRQFVADAACVGADASSVGHDHEMKFPASGTLSTSRQSHWPFCPSDLAMPCDTVAALAQADPHDSKKWPNLEHSLPFTKSQTREVVPSHQTRYCMNSGEEGYNNLSHALNRPLWSVSRGADRQERAVTECTPRARRSSQSVTIGPDQGRSPPPCSAAPLPELPQ